MKTDLDHLPDRKQRELRHVVRVLFEEFEREIGLATQAWKKRGRILKVILYGSYARGDWVDDPVGGYKSDYDILVVVNDAKLTDPVEYWGKADDRLMRDATINEALSAPVNFIVHDLADVNSQLTNGRPFFVDIANQGIALYEAEGFELTAPRILPPDEARAEAEKHFERWFAIAQRSLTTFKLQRAEGDDRYWRAKAAFELHQATEQLYHCTLLVLTLYSPKSHKLNFLRSHAEDVAPDLIVAWPRADKRSRRCFDLLRQAYVNARYSPHFEISDDELTWLAERVAELRTLVKAVCEKRLAPRD
ncbi:nucleotidyltransferase [Sphingomonas spermidinifaciens]|uniref:Nucleotidyltransferase n=1 Tax=Sphingomonas spermidinifaciens TaxID=1141889 RepID=A0A2A4B3X2_9SPHN|nr:HEPN domain-containing protein [Sphingomonas spermidinifaciens]PCD02438.1 nucleotidyltransferase [Sphingomonas spermidinifaciens]